MNLVTRLVDRFLAWLGWVPPAITPRPRRLRMTCPSCGKDLAVIRSTGRAWGHRCVAPRPAHVDPILDPRD
jgi:hypothetical protein